MTAEQVPVAEPVLFPGGVADPWASAGYIADDAGIVAVRLRDGQLLWRTDRAQQPLISDGDRLAAARLREPAGNTLDVVVLDATWQGQPLLVSDPVVLPAWVTVAAERRETFRMNAYLEDNLLRLKWAARARYVGGAPPPSHIRRDAARDAVGVVEIDLDSGSVAPLLIDLNPSAPTGIRRPPLSADDLAEPWIAGTAVARLVWSVDDAEQILALETSDPSERDTGAVVELSRGQGLVAQVTPDGCHLFVHEEQPGAARGPWWVFSAGTGQRVATLTHDPGARSPAILANCVFYLVGPSGDATPGGALRARDLASDTLVWEFPFSARRRSPAPRLRQ